MLKALSICTILNKYLHTTAQSKYDHSHLTNTFIVSIFTAIHFNILYDGYPCCKEAGIV